MAGGGPLSSLEIAKRSGCAERYVREWLGSQVAGGYVAHHAISDTYELTPEQALVLADEDSPVFIPNAWAVPASMWSDEDKAIFTEVMQEAAEKTGRDIIASEARLVEEFKKKGLKLPEDKLLVDFLSTKVAKEFDVSQTTAQIRLNNLLK